MKDLPAEIQHYIQEIMPRMEGWCTPEKAEALVRAVLEEKPLTIVEIGVFAGRSLIAMALAAYTYRFTLGCEVIGIDPWLPEESVKGWEGDPANRDYWGKVPHSEILAKCREALKDQGVDDVVTLIQGTSREVRTNVAKYKDNPEILSVHRPDRKFRIAKIELLHIDGNHSPEAALFDVEAWVPLVPRGGIICFDDLNWATTQDAQKRLREMADEMKIVEAGGQVCGFFRKL